MATEHERRFLTATAVVCVWLFAFTFLDPLVLAHFRAADPNLIAFWRTLTRVGDSGWMLAVSAATALAFLRLAAAASTPRLRAGAAHAAGLAGFAFAAVALTGLAAAALKLAIGRARPKLADAVGAYHFEPLAFDFKLNSLPSGHAATLFALAAAAALIWPRWRAAAVAVAVWGAVSRTAAGAHYLSDVVAGAALGHYGARGLACALARRGLVFAPGLRLRDPSGAAAAGRRLARGLRKAATDTGGRLQHAIHRAAVQRRRADAQ